MSPINNLGQPIGTPVPGWTPRSRPPRTAMAGRFCRLEPLDIERHAADLYEAYVDDRDGRNWTYFTFGPFEDLASYRAWLNEAATSNDPLFHAIVDAAGKAIGVAALMRIDPASGVIEVGHPNFSPRLQRTAAATEAMYLMMRRVFDELGYRGATSGSAIA